MIKQSKPYGKRKHCEVIGDCRASTEYKMEWVRQIQPTLLQQISLKNYKDDELFHRKSDISDIDNFWKGSRKNESV